MISSNEINSFEAAFDDMLAHHEKTYSEVLTEDSIKESDAEFMEELWDGVDKDRRELLNELQGIVDKLFFTSGMGPVGEGWHDRAYDLLHELARELGV